MKDKIISYLTSIEKQKNIRILLACETGSRAWGFPSTDSDYDVRIIYVHEKDWYLSLSERKDSISVMYENNEIDITGWDLRKSLRLLRKSNAALLERIQSQIIYRVDPVFLSELKPLAQANYSRIACINHYLSMAKKFDFDLKKDSSYKLKAFFYALRSATACKWIIEKEEIPPIDFHEMLGRLNPDPKIIQRVNELTQLKATISEGYMHTGEQALFDFIADCIAQANDYRDKLPSSKASSQALDSFFLKTLT